MQAPDIAQLHQALNPRELSMSDPIEVVVYVSESDSRYIVEISTNVDVKTTSHALPIDPNSYLWPARISMLEDSFGRSLMAGTVRLVGGELFKAVFSGGALRQLDRAWTTARRSGRLLRVRLHDFPLALARLPWELIWDKRKRDDKRNERGLFLAASPGVSLLRSFSQDYNPELSPTYSPLRLIFIAASPPDLTSSQEIASALMLAGFRRILHSWLGQGLVTLDYLDRACMSNIRDKLTQGYDILLFVGHASLDEESGEGYLVLEADEDVQGRRDWDRTRVSATNFAQVVVAGGPKLVILNACETAKGDDVHAGISIAETILSAGVPAVLALRYEMTQRDANHLQQILFLSLSQGLGLELAVTAVRRTFLLLHGEDSLKWSTPILVVDPSRVPTLQLQNFGADAIPQVPRSVPLFAEDALQPLPYVQFMGRRRELRIIEDALKSPSKHVVHIQGLGGMGKTALALQACTHAPQTYCACLALSFRRGMTGWDLLSMLADRLEHCGDRAISQEVKQAKTSSEGLDLIVKTLTAKRYVVLLDGLDAACGYDSQIGQYRLESRNLESILVELLNGDHQSMIILTYRYSVFGIKQSCQESAKSGMSTMLWLDDLEFHHFWNCLSSESQTDDEVWQIAQRLYSVVGGLPLVASLLEAQHTLSPIDDLAENRLVEQVRQLLGIEHLWNQLEDQGKYTLSCCAAFAARRILKSQTFPVTSNMIAYMVKHDSTTELAYSESESLVDRCFLVPHLRNANFHRVPRCIASFALMQIGRDQLKSARGRAGACLASIVLRITDGWTKVGLSAADQLTEAAYHFLESGEIDFAGSLASILTERWLQWGFLDIAKELNEQVAECAAGDAKIRALHHLGIIASEEGKHAKAESLIERCIELRPPEDFEGRGADYEVLGAIAHWREDFDQAETFYNIALSEFRQAVIQRDREDRQIRQDPERYAEFQEIVSRYPSAAKHYGPEKGQATTLLQLADLTIDRARAEAPRRSLERWIMFVGVPRDVLEKALSMQDQALALYRQASDLYGEAMALYSQARLLRGNNRYSKARQCAENALRILHELGSLRDEARAAELLSTILYSLGDRRMSEHYCTMALSCVRASGSREALGSTYSNRGVMLFGEGNYDEAVRAWEEAIFWHRRLGDLDGVARYTWKIAQAYAGKGDWAEAIERFVEAYRQLEVSQSAHRFSVAADLLDLKSKMSSFAFHRLVGDAERRFNIKVPAI